LESSKEEEEAEGGCEDCAPSLDVAFNFDEDTFIGAAVFGCGFTDVDSVFLVGRVDVVGDFLMPSGADVVSVFAFDGGGGGGPFALIVGTTNGGSLGAEPSGGGGCGVDCESIPELWTTNVGARGVEFYNAKYRPVSKKENQIETKSFLSFFT